VKRLALLFATPLALSAQLVLSGPIPKGPNPPVVFLNGYQSGCSGTNFASNFGAADQLLQAQSIVSLYFDNCSVGSASNRPSIEALGIAFGQFLAGLKYTDGSAVTQVDAVAHSMGGLILRSYLSGKQDVTPASFQPPLTPAIRRAVFLATPHFGSTIAGAFGIDKQTQEMAPGSQFLFDLNTWNQGSDDLRGISAIAVAGNGGSGLESGMAGDNFDDGVVSLTSASLGFYKSAATRVVPDCHTLNSLLTAFGYCPTSAKAINQITNDTSNAVSQIIVSFLTGTNAWLSVGQAAESTPSLAMTAGVELQLRDQNDAPQSLSGVTIPGPGGTNTKLPLNSNAIAYAEMLPATTSISFQVTPVTGSITTAPESLPATTVLPAVVKPGPMIFPKGVIPAAGPAPFPYDVAPGAYVAIYGNFLSSNTMTASQPYPPQLADVQVLVNGVAQPIVYISAGQINFVYANSNPGLTQVTVKNANGQNTVNVRVAPAVPSIFASLDANAIAAAVNALTGVIIGPNAPLHSGDIMALFLTGLGATTRQNNLDYAQIQPIVSVGGQACAVSYAGRAPSFAGLDQINCTIPPGVTGSKVPVTVTSTGRTSNTAYLNVQ
jgi:uncharacterized protein (TIGR03437 family)